MEFEDILSSKSTYLLRRHMVNLEKVNLYLEKAHPKLGVSDVSLVFVWHLGMVKMSSRLGTGTIGAPKKHPRFGQRIYPLVICYISIENDQL